MDNSVAIIGGGPAGIATARALKILGIPFTIFERHSDFGGIWDVENPGTPMYDSAHFISSKTLSGHEGFPMPDHYPDYPSHRQILSYARAFARAFGLYEDARFRTTVEKVERDGDGWSVVSRTGDSTSTGRFRWVVAASGTNWYPNRPVLAGEAGFAGDIMHAVDYRSPEIFRGRRVLVVGAGNSGVDIACDAAYAAEQAFSSFRRGYHFVPKHIMGKPADVFAQSSKNLPMWLQQRSFGLLLRVLNGDLTRLGLQKPDHRVLESHPIMNTQVLHFMQHGDLLARPDIERLEGSEVVFKDGRRDRIDLIVLATGYNWHLPYLANDNFAWRNDRPRAFMKIFNPKVPSLFLNGYIETNGGAYKLFDEMAMLIGRAIDAQAKGGPEAQRLAEFINGPEPDLGGRVRYVRSARHTGYTNVDAFKKAMAGMQSALGWEGPETFYGALPPAAADPGQPSLMAAE